MTTENEKLVKTFLKEIKKHLPEWLKSNEVKVDDILIEVSSHIWDSAQEIADSEDPDRESIQEAINRLGSPKEIAKSYKKRGTPKIFISEELWPTYGKVIGSLTFILLVVVTIIQVVFGEPNNFLQALISGITTSYPIILTFVVIVTAIFVGLSEEGYFPKDFGSKDTKSDYYKPDEFLFNGLFGILFGLFIIILPIDMINLFRIIVNFVIELFGGNTLAMSSEYVGISPELQLWLILIGIVAIITGLTHLAKMRSKAVSFQLNMNILLILGAIADFGLSLYILGNLHLFSEVLPLAENILIFLAFVGAIGSAVDIITKISKNIKLYGLLEDETSS